MVDMNIVEQKSLTMVELKDKLGSIKKEKSELNFRANKVYAYLEEFVTLKKKDADELHKKLSGLGIQRLRERHITKIIDVMPEDQESLKTIFSGEAVTLKQDELKQILDVVNG